MVPEALNFRQRRNRTTIHTNGETGFILNRRRAKKLIPVYTFTGNALDNGVALACPDHRGK